MAHSITHQPGPSLPFPAAARTNPLGFSFGISSFSPHASPSLPSQQSPSGAGGSGSGFTFPRPAQPSPIGFGFSQNNSHNHASSSTPLARQGSSTSARPLPYTSSPVKKKRSRQSSLSSTSSSPTSAWATLPSPKALGQSKGLLDVGGMALDDGDRRKVVRRNMKRIRQEGATSVSQADNVDLGVLLATLPPTSHLPILLHLLKQDPSLESTVMSQIPEPDLTECLAALDKSMSKCRKALGVASQVGVDPQRRWSRASPEVEELVRMASTYLSFFSSSSKTPSDPHATHQLLHAITIDVLLLLGYVPSEISTEVKPVKQLLDLAKALLEQWTGWITDLSREVNQNGSMFPHSLATQWADGLDSIAQPAPKLTSPTWSVFGSEQPVMDNHLVSSFRQAMAPLRQSFYSDLGWVIGRTMMSSH